MKTRNFLSIFLLASVILACKDTEPQPDWASQWVGIYSAGGNDLDNNYFIYSKNYYDINGQTYWMKCVAIVEKVDNITLRMSMMLKSFSETYAATARIPLPAIKYVFNNVKAIDENTLVIDEVVKDSQGNMLLKLDTITKYYNDTYKVFHFKRIGNLGVGSQTFKKIFSDTNLRPLFSMHKPGIAVPFVNKWYYWAMIDGVSYQWDFGDGKTSTQEDNYYEYTKNGNYTMKFSVTDKTGKIYTTQGIVDVYNLPE